MAVFVDTSGLYALLDADDLYHDRAALIWDRLYREQNTLISHNYVIVETMVIVQRRLGPAASRALARDITPLLDVVWVGEPLHTAAVTALLASERRDISLVDWASFELMRQRAIKEAMTFDKHFADQGFHLLSDAT
ncbi:MAG TPA: PIN domain-containing protein [bacterium]|nr:PIN domain-containing protein [bacterium]